MHILILSVLWHSLNQHTHTDTYTRKGSQAEILQSPFWSVRDTPVTSPSRLSMRSAPLRVLISELHPGLAQGKPKYPEAVESAPGHLKNNLWRKYHNTAAFILVHLPPGTHGVMPGLLSLLLGCGDLAWLFPYVGALDRDNPLGHLASETVCALQKKGEK